MKIICKSFIISIFICVLLIFINYICSPLSCIKTKSYEEVLLHGTIKTTKYIGVFGVDIYRKEYLGQYWLEIEEPNNEFILDNETNKQKEYDDNITYSKHFNFIIILIEFITIFIIICIINYKKGYKTKIIDTTDDSISYKVFCTKCHKYFISTMTTLDNKTNECCCPFCNTVVHNEYNNIGYFINKNL